MTDQTTSPPGLVSDEFLGKSRRKIFHDTSSLSPAFGSLWRREFDTVGISSYCSHLDGFSSSISLLCSF